MKCSKCTNEMEKGSLTQNGNIWVNSGSFVGKMLKMTSVGLIGNPYVFAWKCPKCGSVELRVEQKDN